MRVRNLFGGFRDPYGRRGTAPIELVVMGTVQIETDSGEGSGFIVDANGLVVTARHVVVDGARSSRLVRVRIRPQQEGERAVDGRVFRSHRQLDYALLWLEEDGPYPVLPLGRSLLLRHAETVYAVGAPAGLPNTVSRGIISNPRTAMDGIEYLQTDAAASFGNSGGPLVDGSGRVVAINVGGFEDVDAANFSIPLDYLLDDINWARSLGRQKCLSIPYCPSCGWSQEEPFPWYCPNCGVVAPGEHQD